MGVVYRRYSVCSQIQGTQDSMLKQDFTSFNKCASRHTSSQNLVSYILTYACCTTQVVSTLMELFQWFDLTLDFPFTSAVFTFSLLLLLLFLGLGSFILRSRRRGGGGEESGGEIRIEKEKGRGEGKGEGVRQKPLCWEGVRSSERTKNSWGRSLAGRSSSLRLE